MRIQHVWFSCVLLCLAVSAAPLRLQSQASSQAPGGNAAASDTDSTKGGNSEATEQTAENDRLPITICHDSTRPRSILSFLPTSNEEKLPGGQTGRERITPDYFVIEYDAESHETAWRDYKHVYDPGRRDFNVHDIVRNGSFLPIIYTREKMAVHVCNLRFNDQLTVTTSPIALPEGGADIRGATVTTALPSLTGTLDALQTAAATGSAVPLSGVGFTSSGSVTLPAVVGVAPGTLTPSNGSMVYTDATVTASGTQLAELLLAAARSADALEKNIEETRLHPDNHNQLPGSLDAINTAIAHIEEKTSKDVQGLESYFTQPDKTPLPPAAMRVASNYPAFDEDLSAVQALAAQLTILSGSLSAQGFGTRAATLQTSYASYAGVLDFIQQGRDQHNCQLAPAVAPAPAAALAPALTPAQIGQMTPEKLASLPLSDFEAFDASQIQAIDGAQLAKLSNDRLAAIAKPRAVAAPAAPAAGQDQPTCGTFEKEKFDEFYKSYRDELVLLKVANPDSFETDTGALVQEAFAQLHQLKDQLEATDKKTGKIFDRMNSWYRHSSMEQTDVLTPPNNNTLMRVSIVVQRGYTPFTLTGNPSAPAAEVPTAAASTSTVSPAHTDKTILVEVHRLANFNLAGGVMVIHVPTASYSVVAGAPATASPTNPAIYMGTCNGHPVTLNGVPTSTSTSSSGYTAPTYTCIAATQQSNWQVAGMTGITWYPVGRDYFPRRKGYSNYARNYIPGILVATSVTSLGSGFGGGNFEPLSGIDFFAGIASANRNVLPTGVSLNSAQATGYTLPSVTQLHVGFSAGIAFDLNVITTLFSKTSAPSGGLP